MLELKLGAIVELAVRVDRTSELLVNILPLVGVPPSWFERAN